ncbi:MAG TPA: DUF3426 domain-containing protein [Polynucleobacter sp.]|nr:DUF3426 domain-containing protein [Polynucleobacter sp.]
MHGTLPNDNDKKTSVLGSAQKKSLKVALLGLLLLSLLVLGEHLFRNSLLPALAPRIDGSSHPIAVKAFSALQKFDTKLCGVLECTNRSVSDFSAWKISLVTLTPENAGEGFKNLPNQSRLQVEIQNRLALPVLFPNLEISLTDAEESEIKAIVLSPSEWLPTVWQEVHPDFLQQGAPSGEIFQLEIPIALPNDAAGYRVRIFYPQ